MELEKTAKGKATESVANPFLFPEYQEPTQTVLPIVEPDSAAISSGVFHAESPIAPGALRRRPIEETMETAGDGTASIQSGPLELTSDAANIGANKRDLGHPSPLPTCSNCGVPRSEHPRNCCKGEFPIAGWAEYQSSDAANKRGRISGRLHRPDRTSDPSVIRKSKRQAILEFFALNPGIRFTSPWLHARFGSSFRTRASEINRGQFPISIKNHTDVNQGVEVSVYWSEKR